MGIRSFLVKPAAFLITRGIRRWASRPLETQEKQFRFLLKNLSKTAYGKEKGITGKETYEEFRDKIPVGDYEGMRSYIDRVIAGENDVLWPGRPVYFAKTSGTTSGVKYIPISKDSVGGHVRSARNALMCYMTETGNAAVFDGKLIFLSGSPVLEKKGGILTGRLSGIVNHHIPSWLKGSQVPSWKTNCIEEWEEKVEAIVDETLGKNLTLISGIPPWVQMYFDRLTERSGKATVGEVFPGFSVLVYGGVNFEPYRARLMASIGRKLDTIETYPASEGFIAYQDSQKEPGLLLILNEGIFYEFIPVSEYFSENPTRISLKDVETGVNYALIMNTSAGLWGYSIGDTVKFVSKDPYRIVVTGRIKHFISAFGEHVIAEEVESAMADVAPKFGAVINEFTVAPMVSPQEGLPYHEWLIAFEQPPADLRAFAESLDQAMQQRNIYYRDLLDGNILRPLVITPLKKNAFIEHMKQIGKLGGQNKVPRLANDRSYADPLQSFRD